MAVGGLAVTRARRVATRNRNAESPDRGPRLPRRQRPVKAGLGHRGGVGAGRARRRRTASAVLDGARRLGAVMA